MPVFAYRGLSASGQSVNGVIDADSVRSARGKLREIGIYPTDLAEEAAARSQSIRQWFPAVFRRKIPPTELALLTRQLSALLGAGVQLVDALAALGEQSGRTAAKKMLSQVRGAVREGSSLADALAAQGDVFSDLYVGMVRAGETAGALETVLDRLADYSEKQSEFVSKVRGALTYPLIMVCVGGLIMGFLVTYVIPQVVTIFQEQQVVLPLPTRMLIALSDFLTCYWSILLIGLVAAITGVVWGMSTVRGRDFYDRWILHVPFVGPTLLRVACARFARTLATLLASGVQLLPSLAAARRVMSNRILSGAIEQSQDSIREGHGMAQTLDRSKLFPPLLVEMIRVGERSGELERMLERVADNYEHEVATSLRQMTTVLEPMMTLVMAAVIVFMMLAVLLPIFQLNQLMR